MLWPYSWTMKSEPGMDENLEVFFCEFCNESIPEKDLQTGVARRVNGKVVGRCCLGEMQPSGNRSSGSSASVATVGILLLVSVTAATMFLDWRLSDETNRIHDKLAQQVDARDSEQKQRWTQLRSSLEDLSGATRGGLQEHLIAAEEKTVVARAELQSSLQVAAARLGGLEESMQLLRNQNAAINSGLQNLEKELLRLSRDLASLQVAPVQVLLEELPDAVPNPASLARDEAPSGLSTALMHQLARLKDKDPGNRFEAVDELVHSGNAEVREPLLAMLNDADPFVRRLTAEGLSKFRHVTCVNALLMALADPESIVRDTAHQSLQRLTDHNIEFDPDASASVRGAAVKRWQEWWKKNRDAF